MVIARVRVIPYRHLKKLGGDEEIYTPRVPSNKEDTNVPVQCAFCAGKLLMSSIKASTFNSRNFDFIFCSPICKLKSLLKDRDPNKCWIFTRPGFVWDQRMFSFRALCYQIHFNEEPPLGKYLRATCRQKKCANPLHVEKKMRVFSLD